MRAPFKFLPVYQSRIWGGNQFRSLLGRDVPKEIVHCGEAWEIVDRPEAQSIVESGPFMGLTLNELWSNRRDELFGKNMPDSARFPLLFKILDCEKDLSIQVHPPEEVAKCLGGEAKSELWYVMGAKPKAKVYVGFRDRLTTEQFRDAIEIGALEEKLNILHPQPGEAIYLESGRLHALGAGLMVYEIQQNSDTTYRVFDWNRKDENGNMRQLHIEESIKSIDFEDVNPSMDPVIDGCVSDGQFFKTIRDKKRENEVLTIERDQFSILSILNGEIKSTDETVFSKGDTVFIPCGIHSLTISRDTQYLLTSLKITKNYQL